MVYGKGRAPFQRDALGSSGAPSHANKGAFIDGSWRCNCSPRLPALYLQTKKKSLNEGRWFYTCPKPREDRDKCNFFLWADEAQRRETAIVPNNPRSEPSPSRGYGGESYRNTSNRGFGQIRPKTPPPPYTLEEQERQASMKRKRGINDDEYNDDSIAWDEAEDPSFVTPSRFSRTETYNNSAKRRLPWAGDSNPQTLPTPVTERRRVMPLTSPVSSSETIRAIDNMNDSLPNTPTPLRAKNSGVNEAGEDPLLSDVLAVFKVNNVNINQTTLESLSEVLLKHSLKTIGISKGRDLSRLSIKAKEARINELQYRISSLEAELDEKNGIIEHLNWERQAGE